MLTKKTRRLLNVALSALDEGDTSIAYDVLHTAYSDFDNAPNIVTEDVDLSQINLPADSDLDSIPADDLDARVSSAYTRAMSRLSKVAEDFESSHSFAEKEEDDTEAIDTTALDDLADQFDAINKQLDKQLSRRVKADDADDILEEQIENAEHAKMEEIKENVQDLLDIEAQEHALEQKEESSDAPEHVDNDSAFTPSLSPSYRSPLNEFGPKAFKGNLLKPSAAISYYLNKK